MFKSKFMQHVVHCVLKYCMLIFKHGLLCLIFDILFIAHQYCIWTDGLNALLGKEMTSELTKSDMDTLVTMEIKLRLLDLENVQIPDVPPPLPKEPKDYDFVYDYSQRHT